MDGNAGTANAKPRVVSRFDARTTAIEAVRHLDLTGTVAIVTGGASGLGAETVRALAIAGATVTIAARNLVAAAEAAEQINREIGALRVSFAQLDLGDLNSVRRFAKDWGGQTLSLLINNAGIMASPLGRTRDGFETQFGTNHLGHFLLAVLLTPALERGASSRVVSLSSSGHMASDVDFEDPNYLKRPYHPFKAYGQAKTANALFAVEYDRLFQHRGIRAFAVMPGVIETNLGRYLSPEYREKLGFNMQGDPADTLGHIRKTPAQGAATSVWAATAPELTGLGGLYLEDCAQARPFSPELPRGTGVMPHALDPDAARRLWTLSEQLVDSRT